MEQKSINQIGVYRILVILLALLLFWKWNCGGPDPCPTITETVTRDTIYLPDIQVSPIVKPKPVTSKPGKMPEDIEAVITHTTDTSWVQLTSPLLKEFFTTHTYDTTFEFGKNKVRVWQEVKENKVQSMQLFPTFSQQVITNKVTQAVKQRNQFYVGVDAYSGVSNPLYGAGVSLMLKTKKNKIYEAGPVFFKDQPIMARVGVKFLISTR